MKFKAVLMEHIRMKLTKYKYKHPSDFGDKDTVCKDSRQEDHAFDKMSLSKTYGSYRPQDSSSEILPFALLQPLSVSLVGDDRRLNRRVNEMQHSLSIFDGKQSAVCAALTNVGLF